jgi:hypothetical protein
MAAYLREQTGMAKVVVSGAEHGNALALTVRA